MLLRSLLSVAFFFLGYEELFGVLSHKKGLGVIDNAIFSVTLSPAWGNLSLHSPEEEESNDREKKSVSSE